MNRSKEEVKQIISAEHWWSEYKDEKNISYFKKLIGFAWKNSRDQEESLDFIAPVDDFSESNFMNEDNPMESKNFVRIFYRPDFHKHLCHICFSYYRGYCDCEIN